MPRIFGATGDEFKSRLGEYDKMPVNRIEGVTSDGRVVVRDCRCGLAIRSRQTSLILMTFIRGCGQEFVHDLLE
jgi:hypothetical protein